MININDLNSEINKKKKLKEEIYEMILEKCHNRIKLSAASNNLGFCFYTIPKYIYGVPIYDYHACLMYLVKTLDIEHLEAIMRTELGGAVVSMSSRELKRDAYRFAKSQPALFIEIANDEDIKLRNLANRAVEAGIINLTDDNTVFKFANGKKILTVPFDQHPYTALSQYFKTDEGIDLMKSLTKKLS